MWQELVDNLDSTEIVKGNFANRNDRRKYAFGKLNYIISNEN